MRKYMTANVRKHLVEIFKAVADCVDGDLPCPQDIKDAYDAAMSDKQVLIFYEYLIDENRKNWGLGA